MTNASGVATIELRRNVAVKLCVRLDNPAAIVRLHLLAKEVCFTNSKPSLHMTITLQHPYANLFAQANDSYQYVRTVGGQTMPKVDILTGWLARTLLPDGRARVFCNSFFSSLYVSFPLDVKAMLAETFVHLPSPLIWILDYLYSADVILPDVLDSDTSRGVMTHEYGHFAMCALIYAGGGGAAGGGEIVLKDTWVDLGWELIRKRQSADNEAAYLAEGFADFFAGQVVGGVNYWRPYRFNLGVGGIDYCVAPDTCLDDNVGDPTQQATQSGPDAAFQQEVARVTTILHDAFDSTIDNQDQPGLGVSWQRVPPGHLTPLPGPITAPPADENVALGTGPDLVAVFREFAASSSWSWQLRQNSVFSALGAVMKRKTSRADACLVFELHSDPPACPWVP